MAKWEIYCKWLRWGGTGDGPDGKSISRAEKRLERAQEEIGGEGVGVCGGRSRWARGGLHWGGASVSRA